METAMLVLTCLVILILGAFCLVYIVLPCFAVFMFIGFVIVQSIIGLFEKKKDA